MIAAAYSIPAILVFATSALLILGGAVGVISVKNPVHAALCLITTLFGVAVAFVAQSADFLAAVQIIVYAGAIVVLFLFVIMFLGVDRSEHIHFEPLVGQRAFAAVGRRDHRRRTDRADGRVALGERRAVGLDETDPGGSGNVK